MPPSLGKRVVLFTGAGASKLFGYPLTKEILPRIWEALDPGDPDEPWRLWASMRSRDRRAAGAALARAKRLRRYLTLALPALRHGQDITEGASILDLVSVVDHLIRDGQTFHPEIGEKELREFQGLLVVGMNGVMRGNAAPRLRALLANSMLAHASRRGHHFSYITTNYDTSIDGTLLRRIETLGLDVPRLVDFGTTWRAPDEDALYPRPSNAPIGVFKLHGSLNWLRCELCGHLTVNPKQRIAALEFWRSPSREGWNVCWCKGRLSSLLVLPSVVREVRDANLSALWNAAFEAPRLADSWVIAGYSFPFEDVNVRALFLRAWATRVNPSLEINAIQWRDPNTSSACKTCNGPSVARLRYETLFPTPNLRYSELGFGAFVAELPPVGPVKEFVSRLRSRVG